MSSDRPVLHIVPSEPWGGIQALVPMLAREQRMQGRKATILCLGRGKRLQAVANEYGLGAVTRSIAGPFAPLRLFITLLGARRSIIHTHCEPIWAASVIALSGTPRWIEHAHVYPDQKLTWKKRVSQRLQRRFAKRHIAISESIGRSLSTAAVARPDTVDIVHNGVVIEAAPRQDRERSDARFTLGFIGRVVAEKGIFDFLDLAATLAREEQVVFAVYGDGADLIEARKRATALGMDHRITFYGYVEDIEAAWDTLDLVCIFSHHEPFGLVFLEAVQRGVPSISYTNDSGGSEVAATLRSAYQMPQGDIAAAAVIVRNLVSINTPSRLALLAQDRTTVATRFDIATMASGVEAVYRRLDEDCVPGYAATTTTAPQ